MRYLLLAALLACGCGSAAPPTVEPEDTSLLPLTVGNEWTFQVTDSSGVVSVKTQTVVRTTSTADGRAAFVMETSRANNKGTRSVQLIVDGQLLRASEETLDNGAVSNRYVYEPYGLRIDLSAQDINATYSDSHDKHKVDTTGAILETEEKMHTFYVEGVDELVEVPAGTFECVRVRREKVGSTDKTYWYAPGVGKVKEIGGQTEELTAVSLN